MRRGAAVGIVALSVTLASCGAATKTLPGPTVTAAGPTVTSPGPTVTATVTASPVGGGLAPEVCGSLIHDEDGNLGNTICPDGHPNVEAIDSYRSAGFVTIDLDPGATAQQVHEALCTDQNRGLTNPIRATLLMTATALNGWVFTTPILGPTDNLIGTCP